MGSEGVTEDGGAEDWNEQGPGSRPSRLAGAGKQLSIVLEELDLEDEPALGAAVAEAVVAVSRAETLSRTGADAPRPADRGDEGTGWVDEAADAGAGQSGARREHERTLQQLVGEAHAE